MQDIINMFQNPAQHEALADRLAQMAAPPPPGMLQSGGQGLGELLQPQTVAQGDTIPTGPMPAPKPQPGVQWWKQPSDPRPAAQPEAVPAPTAPPSRGFNPNKDRMWREDAVNLSDEEFMQKWGTPKPGGMTNGR